MGRPALSQEHIAAFRARASAVALELFAEHSEVSLRQLAAAMGVSHTTPYRYFESKEELFMVARAEAFRRFSAEIHRGLTGVTDPQGALVELARAYCDYAVLHTAEFRLMFQLGQPHPERYPEAHRAGVEAWRIVERTTQRAIDAGVLAGDTSEIAHLLWAGIHGIVSLTLSHRLVVGRSADSLIEPMVLALCCAYRRSP